MGCSREGAPLVWRYISRSVTLSFGQRCLQETSVILGVVSISKYLHYLPPSTWVEASRRPSRTDLLPDHL